MWHAIGTLKTFMAYMTKEVSAILIFMMIFKIFKKKKILTIITDFLGSHFFFFF